MGGSTAGAAAGAGIGAIIAGMFDDDDTEAQSQPNAGKDLTDADKAELGGTGAVTGELIAIAIAEIYSPGVKASNLTEDQKQTISTLASISEGMAGAASGAAAGKNAAENNSLSLPSGMMNYGQAVASWNQYATDNNLTPEQNQSGLDKLAKGDLPEGENITKAIVEGYQDGVFIAGAFYLAPGDEFNYYSAAVAAGAGYLAPGYRIGGNILINMGGAFMIDGPHLSSQAGSISGSLAGGYYGKYAPVLVGKFEKELPGFVYEISSSYISEYGNDATKDLIKKIEDK
jgi:filamentous hemagglutinin